MLHLLLASWRQPQQGEVGRVIVPDNELRGFALYLCSSAGGNQMLKDSAVQPFLFKTMPVYGRDGPVATIRAPSCHSHLSSEFATGSLERSHPHEICCPTQQLCSMHEPLKLES